MTKAPYDSREDTMKHIARVRELVGAVVHNLQERANTHDLSKLEEPEKSVFDICTPKLRELTYGSDEYVAQLKELGKGLAHHYKSNAHHPEHYPDGVYGMSLLDIVEMFCDWKAATERHADGDLGKSININKDRFKYNDLLERIFENTKKEMGW